jgi:hypothetical protein
MYIVLLGCMCVILSACPAPDPDPDPIPAVRVAHPSSLSFSVEGETKNVIYSNMELNLSCPDWITVTKKKDGERSYVFEATAAKNESNDLRIGQIVYDYKKDSKNGSQIAAGVLSVLQYGKTTE